MSLFVDLETDKKRLENGGENRPFLGNITGTEVPHERRGLQGIQSKRENSAAIIEKVDSETGEIAFFRETKNGLVRYRDSKESRAYRFFLKSVVVGILNEIRISRCLKARVPGQEVEILKSVEYGKAHFVGLMRCSSPWGCPCCATQISERRKVEVKAAIETAKLIGLGVSLMTLTVPHGLGDDVKEIREKLSKAWRLITTLKAGQKVIKQLGIVGTIRALEVTYGDNGFHPHFHFLVFTAKPVPTCAIQLLFTPLWQNACLKLGLGRPSDERGVDVRNGEEASNYVSKGSWGLESELTKGQTKLSKSKTGSTPLGLLENYALSGCERSKRLFIVYFKAFKGARQLYWSNGLKKRLAVEDFTDEELIAKEDDSCSILATLTIQQWRAVLATRSEAPLLDLAERNPVEIKSLLDAIQVIYKKLCEARK